MTQKTREFLRNGGYVLWAMIAASAFLFYLSFTETIKETNARIGQESSVSCVFVDAVRFIDDDGEANAEARIYSCVRRLKN